jgi:hypothetical protein
MHGQPRKRLFSLNFRQIPAAGLAFLLLIPAHALAWGVEGHEIVTSLALRELTPMARGQVAHLLGGEAMMVHEANWADEIRDQRRNTGPWHYVDIPLRAPGYDRRRDCERGDCVVAQIEDEVRLLGDRRANDRARGEALRFLIHFVADVHQPLHAADDDDRGGNQVHVSIGRERATLHKVWDVDVVEGLGLDVGAVTGSLARDVTAAQRKAWQSGTPAAWATEAHTIARDQIYPPLDGRRNLRLPRDYADQQTAITRMQLTKAGLRLAWLLNGALR